MARSTSADGIGFRNLKKINDSMMCKHGGTKIGKSGEKCSNENSHGSPSNPNTHLLLSLGTRASVSSSSLGRKDFLLANLDSKIGTAAKRFGELSSKLMEKFDVIISAHANPKKGNAHRVWKVSSNHASTGTTCPPSLIDIEIRGE